MPVAGLAQAVGLLIVLVGVLVVPGQSSAAALGWGAVAGLAGAIGLMVYFRALAIGAIAVREGLLVLTSVVTGLYPVGGGTAGVAVPARAPGPHAARRGRSGAHRHRPDRDLTGGPVVGCRMTPC
ncbi:hypothetical protein BH23ACT9_BH23ACT9_07820 [soil metagenome]